MIALREVPLQLYEVERAVEETQAYYCLDCGVCASVCPTARANRRFSPRLLVQHSLLAPEEVLREPELWSCLACGTCSSLCPSNVDFPGFVRRLRAIARLAGRAGVAAHGGVFPAIARLSTGAGPKRLDWAKGLETSSEADVLFFAGCAPYFDAVFRALSFRPTDALRDALRLLAATGTKTALLPNEACCGHDAFWTGNTDLFRRLAEHNLAAIAASGAKRVVTACPECARTLKLDYPAVGEVNFEVLHLSQLLDELMAAGKIEAGAEGKVVFHDPCRLSRHLNIVAAPRRVLSGLRGLELIEAEDSGARSLCCGTASWQNCDYFSEAIRVRRLQEAAATGARTLVTACPKCRIHFRCTLSCRPAERGLDARMEVVDLASLVARGMGLSQR
ncbi:MAG: (Fe-S)-binding protein [Pseudomonadota bacterium]